MPFEILEKAMRHRALGRFVIQLGSVEKLFQKHRHERAEISNTARKSDHRRRVSCPW